MINSKSFFAPRLILVALFSTLSALPALAQWEDAIAEIIANEEVSEVVNNQCLATGPTDDLHLVYQESRGPGEGWNLMYRSDFGAGWSAPQLINPNPGVQQAYAPALTVGDNSSPAVVFIANSVVWIALYGEVGFTTLPLSDGLSEVYTPAIDVGGTFTYHVVWVRENGDEDYAIDYLVGDGFDWSSQTLPVTLGQFGSGAAPRVTADENGSAHIVFRGGNYPDYHVYHAHNTSMGSTDWTIDLISTPNTADYTADFEIDSGGDYHILVSGNDGFGFPGRIHHLRRSPEGTWSPASLISGTFSAVGGELAVDGAGIPFAMWAETSGNFYTGNLGYSREGEVAWIPEIVLGDDYASFSFILDSQGYGHLLYASGANTGIEDVYYLESDSPLNGPAPALSFTPEALDFGTVITGSDSTRELLIENTSNETVTVTGLDMLEVYSVLTVPPFAIDAGGSRTLQVTFAPAAAADYNGALAISTDEPASYEVPTTGTGAVEEVPPLLLFSPEQLDFDTVMLTEFTELEVSVVNIGGGELIIDSYLATPSYSTDFDPPVTIPAEGSTSFLVRFTPMTIGEIPGELILYSNVEDGADTLELIGVGETESSAPGDEAIPGSFYLAQNYPNPFNPSTTIRYGIAEPAHVTVEIRDLLGRSIAVLLDSEQSAGEHAISWSCAECAAGIYFIELTAGELRLSRKAVLLK